MNNLAPINIKLKNLINPMTLKQIEWIVLLIVGIAYMYPSPVRDSWIWLIVFWGCVVLIRLFTFGRMWTNTLLDEFFTIFLGLCLISIFSAPYETRGIILIFRPLFGFLLVLSLVEHVRIYKDTSFILNCTIVLGLVVSIISLISVNFSGKSSYLAPIYELIPRIEVFFLQGGVNPNEIAGVITLFLPFCFYILIKARHFGAGLATLLFGIGLFLGQSLSGITGTVVGIVILLTPYKLWKYVALFAVLSIVLLQAAIMTTPENTAQAFAQISGRDNVNSMLHRAELWRSAVDILEEYPLTGVGIAMYRNPLVREDFPTPNYSSGQAVHPHNMLLQFTSDMGWPGLVVFFGWYVIAAMMIIRIDRAQPAKYPHIAPAFAASLIAHAVYGLTDAVPVWDRFGFVFFWFLGLIAAQYYLVRSPSKEAVSDK